MMVMGNETDSYLAGKPAEGKVLPPRPVKRRKYTGLAEKL